jgi:acid phosphatase type 7
MKIFPNALILIFLFISFNAKAGNEPLAILLTWTEDPTTTISIDWHNLDDKSQSLLYKEKGAEEWESKKSKTHSFPFSDRKIHRVALNKLKPGTSYQLKFGEHEKEYYFNTMPENTINEPIRIAIGGDTMHEKDFLEKTNTQVLKYDPHFVVMGGDMAYENGDSARVDRVYDWLDGVKNTLITNDNRIIPLVVGLGNHEVAGGYYSPEKFSGNDEDREKYAPYFYSLFAFPGHPGYNVLDFGNYLSLFILDTEHNSPIEGDQTDWLSSELKKRSGDFLHIVPVYHIPAYPSVRDFNGGRSVAVRRNWLPLFEEHGVKIAFENHDHAYKRTFPIKENRVNENGIVFFGDGAWGTRTREIHDVDQTWYLKSAASQRHFILLTLQGSHQQLTVVNEDGDIIDTYPEMHLQKDEMMIQVEAQN